MHPALRILGVMLFIACLAQARWPVLLLGVVFIGLGLGVLGSAAWRRFGQMARRLVWFYLSIFLIFGWFTPGLPLWPALGSFSPTDIGVLAGLQHTLLIVLSLGAVIWLLQTTSQDTLVRGLLWLTQPLQAVGFPAQRFAVRLVLTLEAAPQVHELATQLVKDGRGGPLERSVRLLDTILTHARQAPLACLTVSPLAPPRMSDWLKLAMIIMPMFWLAVMY